MTSVLQYHKLLNPQGSLVTLPSVSIRHFACPDTGELVQQDTACWLDLRRAAWDAASGTGRDWAERDVIREFLGKPWWDARRLLLAFDRRVPAVAIGSVVATPGRLADESTLNWLMVRPGYRRQGVAQALLSQLEHDCVARGERILRLETLATWQSAIAFYEAMGLVTT